MRFFKFLGLKFLGSVRWHSPRGFVMLRFRACVRSKITHISPAIILKGEIAYLPFLDVEICRAHPVWDSNHRQLSKVSHQHPKNVASTLKAVLGYTGTFSEGIHVEN